MIATCPSCNARYRVADEKVSPSGTKFKCKKCKTAFTVYRDMGEQSTREPERRAPAMKACPHCGKPIPAQAVKCRWCREDVTGRAPAEGEGFDEQGGYPADSEHQDPFAPQGGTDLDQQDPFAPQGGPGAEHQDPFAPQGAGEFTSGNPFAEEESFEEGAPGFGSPAAPAAMSPSVSMSYGGPITGKKISPLLFALPMWLGIVAAVAGSVIAGTGGRGLGALLSFTGYICLLYATVYGFIALYRAWNVIPDAYARTTPGKAVGFMFIPLFNFYWVFVAAKGLADDAKDFLEKAGVYETKIGTGLSLAYAIMFLLSWVPGISLVFLIIETVIIFQWAAFTSYVIDNPGQFARIHSGAPRTTDKSIMFIIVGVLFGGVFVLGILAAILIPALIAARGQ